MQDTGYWFLDTGFWMLVRPPEADKPLAGWMLDTGYWFLDAEIEDTRSRIQGCSSAESSKLKAERTRC
ncbi:hypothetical protein D3OALGB2SA_1379 [Olavius algarvensis associated proteobacterium Delta 3]|nr:hypothetical protein D3OALGB2SA_1379 [Olavius algarvensis associated proteobacterium Delta 3]